MAEPDHSTVAVLRGAADACREQALTRLRQLVDLDSPSGEPRLLAAVHDTLSRRMQELGLTVQSIPGPAGDHLLARAEPPTVAPGNAAPKLHDHSRQARPTILLVGHYDTVWPSGETIRRPFTFDGELAYGPGVLDMKSGLVVVEIALELVRRHELTLAQPVEVVLVADEEVSSPDGRRVVLDAATRAGAAIGLEPSFEDGAAKTARRGVIRVRLEVIGREAHSGLDAAQGISAIDEMLDQLGQLRELIQATDGVELNIGRVEGGTRPNVIAGHSVAELSFRTSLATGEAAVHNWLQQLTPRRSGALVSAEIVASRPVWEVSDRSALEARIQRSAMALGQTFSGRPAGGAGDTNLIAAAGVPCIDGLGPRGGGAHALNEFVVFESLLRRAELLATVLVTADAPVLPS